VVGQGGAWTISTTVLGAGSHTLAARAVDAVGNQSNPSSTFHVTIDTSAPLTPIFSGLGSLNPDGSLSLIGTAEANSSLSVFDNGGPIGSSGADGGGQWFFTTSPLSDVVHVFTATATDAAGNASGTSGTVQFGSSFADHLTGGAGPD